MSRWERGGRALAWLACGLSWLAALGVDAPLIRGYFPASGFRLAPDLACFRDNGAWLGRDLATAAQNAAQVCTYKYPPPFLFLATPLSWLTPEQDFAVWSAASVAALVLAAWALGLPRRAVLLGVLAPPTLLCLSIGESGMILSGLLLLALGWAETAPLAAGIAAGAMIVKPEFGLLLPVCYVASRNGRAFLAASVTAGSLCVLAEFVFGHGVWAHYLHAGIAATRATLAAPWPQRDQHIMVTPYSFAHSLGAGFGLANAAQSVVTLLAAVAAWKLWRGPPVPSRLPMTLCLAALATPFACLYDLSALALVLAVEGGAAFVWFWIFSSLYLFVSVFSVSPGAPGLALLLWMLWRSRKSNQQSSTAMTRVPHTVKPAQASEG
jgi:Glycosyltransferase family 87